jgi:dipeptidyl aminopeptidase/acylaminoacyl peptidase
MKKANLFMMTSILFSLALLIGSCTNTGKAPMKAKQIPLEDFFKNPEKTRYQISPDGKFYSYLAPYESRLNVFVQERGQEETVQITSETDRDIAGYFWPNNEQILYLKDDGGDENYKLYGVNIDGSNLVCFTDFEDVKTQIIDELEDIPDELIIGLNKRNPQVFDPYRLNIKTGEMEMLAENPGTIMGWMFDHDGKLRVAFEITDGVNTSILYRETEQDEWQKVLTTSFKDNISPYFFTFDNKNVIGTSNFGRDKSVVVEFDITNGTEVQVLYENPDYDIQGVYYSKKRKVITAASYTSWKRERHFFDEETKQLFDRLNKDLGEYELGISAYNKDETVYIIRTYSDRSLGAYYIYDKNTDQLEKIVDVSPWIDENEMAHVTPVEYQSRDGLTIHGYLTLPKGYTLENAKKLPVVVNPHGGPWYRDGWGFNPEIQFLANRGYAVFQMNFRGSTGYGKAFWEASFKKWGLEMQDDITDGTIWLIEKCIADPDRIAIYGGSYGGYATLMGLVKEPDLYVAGVDYVGVSNMFTFMKTVPPYWKPMLDMFYEMIGDPKADSLMLREVSPVFQADKIVAPLFIAQGRNDPRVNVDESDQMVEAMKARGIEVEYLVKDDEGHGFRNEENRFDFYRVMETFLSKQMGGQN